MLAASHHRPGGAALAELARARSRGGLKASRRDFHEKASFVK
jgi:hypothetical protein